MERTAVPGLQIRKADRQDIPVILELIKELAEYEKLAHEVTATEERLQNALFGSRPFAEAVMADYKGESVGFALYFHNFSTFLGRRDSTWRISMYVLTPEGRESVGPCWSIWLNLRGSETAAGWNGPFWIGTSPRSSFTEHSMRHRWMNGRYCASAAKGSMSSRPKLIPRVQFWCPGPPETWPSTPDGRARPLPSPGSRPHRHWRRSR